MLAQSLLILVGMEVFFLGVEPFVTPNSNSILA